MKQIKLRYRTTTEGNQIFEEEGTNRMFLDPSGKETSERVCDLYTFEEGQLENTTPLIELEEFVGEKLEIVIIYNETKRVMFHYNNWRR